ncbi:MAG: MBL fold metallo-hydrolase [Candidatus Nealsonbacteria bacterium]|nr:MBL fold metallo-hydrolase [Candidatus Nealsonbacteria bacterium]
MGNHLSIITVFDNYLTDPRLEKGWGFSCFIRYESENKVTKILFDTGDDKEVLLSNMDKMSLDPRELDFVFISHLHHDHTGGLPGILERNQGVKVYKPESFSFSQLKPGIFTTGPLGTMIQEQSLILQLPQGLIIITGCAHPGIVDIVRKSKEVIEDFPSYLVMGGFHLKSASDTEIEKIISEFRSLGVQKVAPSHCSGERCIELFEKAYGSNFIKNGAGKEITI